MHLQDELARTRGLPKTIVVDNGPEFTSQVLDQWAYRAQVELHFFQPGEPVQNAFVESFNGKFRDECLNQSWSVSLADASQSIGRWRLDYNRVRPHSSLGDLTPKSSRGGRRETGEFSESLALRRVSGHTPACRFRHVYSKPAFPCGRRAHAAMHGNRLRGNRSGASTCRA